MTTWRVFYADLEQLENGVKVSYINAFGKVISESEFTTEEEARTKINADALRQSSEIKITVI